MTAKATLSEKFQISIPKAIREQQHWQAGQEFVFLPKDGGVMLVPLPQLNDLVGSIKNAKTVDYRDRESREDRY